MFATFYFQSLFIWFSLFIMFIISSYILQKPRYKSWTCVFKNQRQCHLVIKSVTKPRKPSYNSLQITSPSGIELTGKLCNHNFNSALQRQRGGEGERTRVWGGENCTCGPSRIGTHALTHLKQALYHRATLKVPKVGF